MYRKFSISSYTIFLLSFSMKLCFSILFFFSTILSTSLLAQIKTPPTNSKPIYGTSEDSSASSSIPKENPKENSKENSKDSSKENSKNNLKNSSKDSSQNNSQNNSQDNFKENSQNNSQNNSKENSIKKNYDIHGVIFNKTQNKKEKIDTLTLIKLDAGMQIVDEIKKVGPTFRFTNISNPNAAPFLLQASFQDVKYNHLVLPAKQKLKQTIVVYDLGASFKSINLTVALHVTKKLIAPSNIFLAVRKIYAFNNFSDPPKSFAFSEKEIFIPASAQKIQASLTYSSKNVPIPVALKKRMQTEKSIYQADIYLQPGESLLEVLYEVPGTNLQDEHLTIQDKTPYRILTWSPPNIMPKIQNANFVPIDIPEIGTAYQVHSKPSLTQDKSNEDTTVSYDFSSGSFLVEDPFNSHFSIPFSSRWEIFIALIFAFILGLYLIVFINKRSSKDVKILS